MTRVLTAAGTAVLVMASAACGDASSPATGAEPEPVRVAAPSPPPLAPIQGWNWTAAMQGPWRIPADRANVGIAVVIAGGDRALIGVQDEVVVVDLVTGVVGPPTDVLPPRATLDWLTRVDDRIVAFGRDAASRPAAWTIAGDPFVATPLPMRGAGGANTPFLVTESAVSPDATRVLTCQYGGWPTLRKSDSMTAIRVLDGVDCVDPQFIDDDHVDFAVATGGWRAVDLRTGAIVDHDATVPRDLVGPGGRRLEVAAGPSRFRRVRWAADDTAVELFRDHVDVHPPSGPVRRVDLPAARYFGRNGPLLAVGGGHAVVVVDYDVIAIDLDDGEVHAPAGSLGLILDVATRAGSVVIAADRIREYRNGDELHAGGTASRLATEPPDLPVVALDDDHGVEWDPATGAVRELAAFETANRVVSTVGDEVVFDDGDTVYRAHRGHATSRWFRFAPAMTLEAIDASTGRVAWRDGHVFRVADVDRDEVWSLAVIYGDECQATSDFRFVRGTPLFAIETDDGLELFDLATRTRLGGVRLTNVVIAWDVVPGTGDLIVANNDEIILWQRGARTASVWRTQVGERVAVDLAVDEDGGEVAVAYDDGTIVWARIDGLRAHGAARDVTLHPAREPRCARREPTATPFTDVVLDRAPEPTAVGP